MRAAIMHLIEKVAKTTLTFGAAETEQTFTFKKSGKLKFIISKASDPTNVITYTITITNADDSTLYSVGTLARNATTDTAVDNIPLCDETHTVTVTLSGAPGVSGITVDVTLIVER